MKGNTSFLIVYNGVRLLNCLYQLGMSDDKVHMRMTVFGHYGNLVFQNSYFDIAKQGILFEYHIVVIVFEGECFRILFMFQIHFVI